jgi:hypothetical protein
MIPEPLNPRPLSIFDDFQEQFTCPSNKKSTLP